MSNKIAVVPYEAGEAFDFYDDKVIFESRAIDYDAIEGYSYLLTRSSHSIYFIPTANSTSFTIELKVGGGDMIRFSKSTSSAMLFKGEKHDTVELIYSELVKCIETLIAPWVLQKCLNTLEREEEVIIGGLIISSESIKKKTMFGWKELEQYGETIIASGYVILKEPNGRIFQSVALSTINAPLLKRILDYLFGA